MFKRLGVSDVKSVRLYGQDYPPYLSEIPQPPSELYYLGELDFSLPAVAVVGTRRATRYGLEAAYKLSFDLASSGILVVSGLALGIDSQAHRGAVEAGGKTIAVLGSGVKNIHPLQNKILAQKIAAGHGAVVSEFPPAYPPDKWTFPQRNRIIAGLSRAVIVVEAPEKSGALITARMALDYNRDVGAVPGEITSLNSYGTNMLLKMGAAVIRSADDVLEMLGMRPRESGLDKLTDTAQHLLDLLEKPSDTDSMLKKSGLDPSQLSQELTLLELAGKIKNASGVFHKITNNQ